MTKTDAAQAGAQLLAEIRQALRCAAFVCGWEKALDAVAEFIDDDALRARLSAMRAKPNGQ